MQDQNVEECRMQMIKCMDVTCYQVTQKLFYFVKLFIQTSLPPILHVLPQSWYQIPPFS